AAVAGLEAGDPAERRGPRDRPAGLRAEGPQAHPASHRRRRAAAGAARRPVQVPGVARRRRVEAGVLRGHRLADQDRPGLAEPADDGRVLAGDAVGPELRARGSGPVEHVDDVLDADRDAVQGPAAVAPAELLGEALGLGAGLVAGDEDPGADARLVA